MKMCLFGRGRGQEKKEKKRTAYEIRDALDRSTIQLPMMNESWVIAERERNHRKHLNSPTFLRDIDDVEMAKVVTCFECGKPMVIHLSGNGRQMSMWLHCCYNAHGGSGAEVPVRAFTSY